MKRDRSRHVRRVDVGQWVLIGVTALVCVVMLIVVCDAALHVPLP